MKKTNYKKWLIEWRDQNENSEVRITTPHGRLSSMFFNSVKDAEDYIEQVEKKILVLKQSLDLVSQIIKDLDQAKLFNSCEEMKKTQNSLKQALEKTVDHF